MQQPVIMAFRKRLKSWGYTDISIRKVKDSPNYLVTAVEPLARTLINCEYSIIAMHNAFR